MPANRATIAWHLENQIPREDQRAIGMVYEKMVDVSAAEIIVLNGTPKELVVAPGAGKVLEFVSAVIFLDYGTTAYTGGSNLSIQNSSNTDVSGVIANTALVNQGADIYKNLYTLATAGAEISLAVNTALELTVSGTEHAAGGGGTLKVSILYRTHDFNEKHPRFDN